MADYNSSYTGVQIDTAVGKALNPDATPTAESTELITSGAVKAALDGKVPVYGMGENLLRNWYFIGGGTGRGVFPVNQRGQSSYSTVDPSTIDGWALQSGSISLTSDGLQLSASTRIAQAISSGRTLLQNKTITFSVFITSITGNCRLRIASSDGTTYNNTGIAASDYVNVPGLLTLSYTLGEITSNRNFNFIIETDTNSTAVITACSLEIGTEQTLAHLEGSTWVLNEIPDYEAELIKCQTSTADSTDTFANKSLATEQQLAYVETGTTASRAYAVGEYFCWNGLLYRVISAISSGGTFTPGTNCEQTTISKMAEYWLDVTSQFSTASSATLKVLVNPSIRTVKLFFLDNGLSNGSTAVTIPTQYAPDTSKLVYVSSTDSYRIGIFHGRFTQTPNSFGNIYEFHSFLRYYSGNRQIAVYYPLANPAYAVTFDIEYVY